MEDNKFSKWKIAVIANFYGMIIALANYMGFMLPSTGSSPSHYKETAEIWHTFTNTHPSLVNFITIVIFSIPAIICISYILFSGKNATKRIINLPLAYSFFGTIGWLLNFLIRAVILTYYKFLNPEIRILSVLVQIFIFTFQTGLFIFTIGYSILNTIHRKYLLPKYFSEGRLSRFSNKSLSIKILFLIFYASVGLFPIFYLTASLLNVYNTNNIPFNRNIMFMIGFIVIFGIVLLITFSNSINEPLTKMKDAAVKIEQGNYTEHLNIVSNDSFGDLADTFNDMMNSLDSKTKKINAIQDSIIRGMAVMVESRDNSTGGHISRTSDCVRIFVKKLKESPEYSSLLDNFCFYVIKAAPMHDLGKIAVDDAVLCKPGKFTADEYEIMKKHSAEGARIVENVLNEVDDQEFKNIAINVAHYHHEKWNGNGYPEKISGEQIPLEARIMALADVFDALVSRRCYKDEFSYDEAFSIIQDSLGSHFDPDLGKIFIECKPELIRLYDHYKIS